MGAERAKAKKSSPADNVTYVQAPAPEYVPAPAPTPEPTKKFKGGFAGVTAARGTYLDSGSATRNTFLGG